MGRFPPGPAFRKVDGQIENQDSQANQDNQDNHLDPALRQVDDQPGRVGDHVNHGHRCNLMMMMMVMMLMMVMMWVIDG